MTAVLESWPQADVPASVRAEVEALDRLGWPSSTGADHDPALDPFRVVRRADGIAVATLAILSKTVRVGDRSWALSGLSAVVTHPDHRGLGHGRALCLEARGLMARRGADVGIFTCDADLVPFYEGCGFSVLPGTALLGGTPDDPLISTHLAKTTLAAFFTDDAMACRALFVGASIPLFPGLQDRLW